MKLFVKKKLDIQTLILYNDFKGLSFKTKPFKKTVFFVPVLTKSYNKNNERGF